MLARLGSRHRWGDILPVVVVLATVAMATAEAQPGGRRGPGPAAGPGGGPGGGRGPGPSVGGPGGAGGPGAPGLGSPGAPGPGAGAVPRVPVPVAPVTPVTPAAPAAVAVPQPPQAVPQAGRPAVPSQPPFTPEWYAQHPDTWQLPKPYAEWRSAPVPPAAVVSAFFGTDGGTNPNLTAMTATDWLPLGVFASPARAGGQPAMFQQLAVSKAGQLKGVMADVTTNSVQPISGMADVLSGKVSWTVGQAGGIGYESSMEELLKQAPAVTVITPAGRQPAALMLVSPKE